ncbi:MAG: HAMP domain-containing sensor histidine kinase [Candidatus Aminicenantes bacterium]|nr:HAMP domain-containing sensor histidine kinase [Candidatus Aminicenantes bacterium]
MPPDTQVEMDKLIHKFLHPLLVFSGNSQLILQMGTLLQKALPPEIAASSDLQKLAEEFKARLLGIKDGLHTIDENTLQDKRDRSQINDLEKQLSTIINVLDHSLKTQMVPVLLEIKIRDAAIWALEELNKVNSTSNNLFKTLVKEDFTRFIQGILIKHIIRGAGMLKAETQILERDVEAFRMYTGLEKVRKYSFRTADIGKLVKANIELFEPVLAEKNIQVDYKPRGNLTADISKSDIDRVICNLFHNVRKYGYKGEGRFLKVIAREIQPQNEVEISIQSFGVPIKKEEIASGKLWEFGTRGEFAYESARDGSGVGLADAKEVVEAHGGKISITSVPRGNESDPPQYKVPYLTTVTMRIPKRRN